MTQPEPGATSPFYKKAWFKVSVRLSLSLILLAIVAVRLPLGEVFSYLRQADLRLCLLGYTLYLVVGVIQGMQIGVAAPQLRELAGHPRLIRVHFISAFYGVMIPTPVTMSVVKWQMLSHKGQVRAQAAAVIIYLRALNILTMIIMGLPGLIHDRELAAPALRAAIFVILILFILFTLPFWSSRIANKLGAITARAARPFPIPKGVLEKCAKVWASILLFSSMNKSRHLTLFGMAFVWTLMNGFALSCLANAVDVPIGVSVTLWLQLLLFTLAALPISIAGIGVREATMVTILPTFYGIDPSAALAASFLFMGLYIVLIGAGLSCELYETLFKRR